MCKKITVIILSYLPTILFAQSKSVYQWMGAVYTDTSLDYCKGYMMDFIKSDPSPIFHPFEYGFDRNNASICDSEGQLLLYTNGCAVMNRYHEVMPNGEGINKGEWYDKYWIDCKYGHPGYQDVLILPDPGYENGYYVFHKFVLYFIEGNIFSRLSFSYVDLSLNGGKGDVIKKNIQFYPDTMIQFSYLTAMQHANQQDWWIVLPAREDSVFITFLLDKDGIQRPFYQNADTFLDHGVSSAGTARFSPDGSKYALYTYRKQLHVYDFDRETGQLTNHQELQIYHPDSIDPNAVFGTSVEWSPNSRFIYCASSRKLHQVDTWEADMQDGVRHIADYVPFLDPFHTSLFLMALAPDCKIYMSPSNGSYSLHVIKQPDELGKACNFVQNGIKLPAANGGTLPNFPRFRVDEEDKCDPTISSIFGEAVYYRRAMEVYPNPSHGYYSINLPDVIAHGHLVVTDLQGKVQYERMIHSTSSLDIDITHLPAGTYHIEIYPIDNADRIFYGSQVVKL